MLAQRIIQPLGRGVVAVKRGDNILVSWRRHAQEPEDQLYNIYVGSDSTNYSKLNSEPTKYTSYSTNLASVPYGSWISVATVVDGVEGKKSKPFHFTEHLFNNEFVRVLFDENKEAGVMDSLYQTPYIWPCDLNGDGEYDYVVARNYIYGHGNYGEGRGDIVEAYLHDGTFLWRYDMGVNVWGVHGQNDMVVAYDMDCDGKGDVVVKSSDLSRFWDQENNCWGKYLFNSDNPDTDGDGITNYRDSTNTTRNAPQYITVIDGMTGKEKATCEMDYASVTDGEDQYSRDNKADYLSDKDYWFLNGHFAICYLDGVHPAIVMEYLDRTRATQTHHNYVSAWQYDFTGGTAQNFHQLWTWSRNDKTPWPAEFHQLRVADVDGNGTDEMLQGGYGVNGNGEMQFSAGISHGDRYVVTDIDTSRPGMETYAVQQMSTELLGMLIYDSSTGESIKRVYLNQRTDVGRGDVADIDSTSEGLEWWSTMPHVYAANGEVLSKYDDSKPYPVMGIWWNGSLSRECLGSGGGSQWNTDIRVTDYLGGKSYIAFTSESKSAASTLSGDETSQRVYAGAAIRPLFVGDIYGDWREEVLLSLHQNHTEADGTVKATRIGFVGYSTEVPDTNYMFCLQENPAYRLQCTTRGYYQSAYPDFFLGYNMPKAPLPPVIQADLVWQKGSTFMGSNYKNMLRAQSLSFADGKSIVYGYDGDDSQVINVSSTVKPKAIYAMSPKGKNFVLGGTGSLSGDMTFWKSQQGKFTMNCKADYTGKTIVSEGELALNTTMAGPLELRARGTVSGNATFNGMVSFEKALNYEGCRIMPGDSIHLGKMVFNKNLTLPGEVYLQMKISSENNVLKADTIVTTNLTAKGVNYLSIVNLSDTVSEGEYPLLSWTSNFIGSTSNFKVRGLAGHKTSLEIRDNTLWLVINPQRQPGKNVRWTGAENAQWNYWGENFKLNDEATSFVTNDEVTFGDDAKQFGVNIAEQVLPKTVTFANDVQTYTIDGQKYGIGGEGNFIKKGEGDLYINTSKNNYTGITSLEGGTVYINTIGMAGMESSLGSCPSVNPDSILLKDVELYFNSAQNTTDRGMTITGNVTLTVPEDASAAVTGMIKGTGSLIKDGAGQLNINDTCQYTGNTVILDGIVAQGTQQARLGLATDTIIGKGGTFKLYGATKDVNKPSIYNPILIPAGCTFTLAPYNRANIFSPILGEGTFKYAGRNVREAFRSKDASQFFGTVDIVSGAMRIGTTVNFSNADLVIEDGCAVGQFYGNRVKDFKSKFGSLSSLTTNNSLNGGSYYIGYNNKSTIFCGRINSGATIYKVGTGTLQLNNTSTGNVTVNAGTIYAHRQNGTTISGTATVNAGGTLRGLNTTLEKVIVNQGGVLAVGDSATISTLHVTQLILSDSAVLELKIADGQNDVITLDSALTLQNVVIRVKASGVKAGDQFTVFNGNLSGTYSIESDGVEWDTSELLSSGILKVRSVTDGISGISVDEPDSVRYYDALGRQVDAGDVHDGIFIERSVKNGKVTTRKVIR
jgi:rhamnogalacturonan endolyase